MRTHFGCALLLRTGCAVCLLLALAGWTGAMPVAPATPAGASPADTSGGPHAPAAPTGPTFLVNTAFDGVNPGACAGAVVGQCTLREAILEANATTGATINLPGLLAVPGSYRVSIAASGADDGTTGDLHLTADMSLVGHPSLARSVIIDATGASDRVLYVAASANVNISAVTIRHGTAQTGGGIYNDGTLTLVNSLVFGNTANGSGMNGGGIYNAGTLTLDSSAVSGNTALSGLGGGGLVNDKTGTLTLSHSTVSGNTAGIAGGIRNFGSMHVTGSTVNDNSACCGAGIYNDLFGTLALDTSTIMSNTASDDGGGINNDLGLMTVTTSTVVSNTALVGGGLENTGSLVLTGTMVLSNTAAAGGGVVNDANLTLIGSTIGDNAAGNNGGGIYNAHTLVLTGTTVISNTANAGGGIENVGTLTLDTSTVISNSASAGGGGLDNGGALLATNSTLSRNTGKFGGGIYSHHAGSLTNSTLDGNSSTNASPAGGSIYQAAQYLTETLSLASTIVANSPSGGNCSVDPTGFPLASDGYNLSSDGTCAPYFTQTGDLNGVNPNLGPLADNGGPTLTQRPLFPSPVMDAIPLGTNGCGTTITTDQRGLPRATDGRCDIGAVEYGGLLSRLWLPLVRR
jgi:CSLREA domain-containing protein